MRRYKHWWTYWVWAILYSIGACLFIHRAIIEGGSSNFMFGLCWIGIAIREAYWYFTDRKNNADSITK